MLKDVFTKETRTRDNLQHATARALALGNDITAHGWSTQSMVDTLQDNTICYARVSAVYPKEQLLAQLTPRFPAKIKIRDHIHTAAVREAFWGYYKLLRSHGQTRKQILTTTYDSINNS